MKARLFPKNELSTKWIKGVIRTILAALIVLLLFSRFSEVFRFKYGDGIAELDLFYSLPDDSVDVLVLGSSHAFENINPAFLYKKYGMAAYDLCGGVQPFWSTYHFLIEALKTQQPRLIVLEAYCATFDTEYSDPARIIKNNYGLKWSRNAIAALATSAPSSAAAVEPSTESFTDYLFRFNQYHSRYSDLTKQDFSPLAPTGAPRQILGDGLNTATMLGAGLNTATQEFEKPVFDTSTIEPQPLFKKTEEWYRKIIELCKAKEIPLEIVLVPYPNYILDREKLATARAIAEEYGVPFTDFNTESQEAIGLNYSTDFADPHHMNHRAVPKFNQFFGLWLSDRHELPDRRGEPIRQAWENAIISYEHQMIDQKLKEANSASDYLKLATDSGYFDYTIWVSADEQIEFDAKALLLTLGLTIPDDIDPTRYALISSSEHETAYQIEEGSTFYVDTGSHTIDLSQKGNVLYDRANTKVVTNGLNIVVLDRYHDVVVDIIGIDSQGNIMRESK
jgi:hypothetical protein